MTDPELNPYASSTTTEISLEQRLIAEQNLFATLLGSLVGAVPGFLIYLWLVNYPFYAMIAYFLPGLFIGFFAGFMGRGIDKRHRVMSALVTLGCVLFIGWLLELTSVALGLSFINCVVAALTSTRRLSREEDDALFNYKIGYQPRKQ